MELTVDQALQKGVAAHKAGNLKEAEKLYRAILNTRQNHPDANHNLGVIAVRAGKVLEALPHFKKALEAKPNTEQFWISYIETLIKLGQLNDARQIFQKGKTFGLRGDKIDLLKAKLSNKSGAIPPAEADSNSPSKQQIDELIALYTNSTPQEALIFAKKLIVQFPDDHLIPNILGAFYTALGKHNAAIKNFSKSIEINPYFVEAHNNLGNTLNELGKHDEAISSYNRAIELKPDYPEAYNNLGNTLNELGKHDEAISSYNKAIELKPDYPEAHNNLGKALNELGRHDVAIAVLNNAIKLKPRIAEVHNNLGIALNEIGKHTEATASYNNAIKLKPNYATAYANLGVSLSYMKVKKYSNSLANNYLGVLNSETIARPSDLINSIIILLKHNETIKESISKYHSLTLSSVAPEICNRLSEIPLFMKIMEICPIPDLEIEGLLTELRKLLLLKSANFPNKTKLVTFQSALALQCFTNEYIYKETITEKASIKSLEESLQKAYLCNGEMLPYDIACLASYRSLFNYEWSAAVFPPQDLDLLFKRQVVEPSQETLSKKVIPRLKTIKDETSLAVQEQYEENPYPRWINAGLEVNSMRPAEFVAKMKLQIKKDIDSLSDTPKILIAHREASGSEIVIFG